MEHCLQSLPCLETGQPLLDQAFRLALGCVAANTMTVQKGVLTEPQPCLMAGLDYAQPWTRDAAINVYNAGAILDPVVAENTLRSVLEEQDGDTVIGGQYWDKIIWALGAERLWLVTGDQDFLRFAFGVIDRTLTQLEHDEQDSADGLFRGAAVYGDGVSAYPPKYRNPNLSSGIIRWPGLHPQEAAPVGGGLPMKALSTNCLYVEVYRILSRMAAALGLPGDDYARKADMLKDAINRHFWNPSTGMYDYLCGESDAQEGLGLSFAILFDIADEEQIASILAHVHVTEHGIPCVWPAFTPYDERGYGRHSGTVWPHVQGFWARAMLKCGQHDRFCHELYTLAQHAVRDQQFAEIYHPEDGRIYGGWQEGGGEYILWNSCNGQTWSATAFLGMVLDGLCGLTPDGKPGIPYLPNGMQRLTLRNLYLRGKRTDLSFSAET